MKKLLGLTIIAMTALSGCVGTSISQARCGSYGYDTNSDAYRDCVAEENRERRKRLNRAYGY